MSTSQTSHRVAPAWNELEALAPVRAATEEDRVDCVIPSRVAAPENAEQVSAVLAWANEHDVQTVPRGGGTKLGWSNRPQAVDLVLSLERFDKVIDHEWQDMTVTVQAGTTLKALRDELAQQRQRMPLDALWPERGTVGGVIATNDSGALRVRFGSIRDLILGVTAVLANGTIARSGGRVVKNVAGYDLPKLFSGSFGTLGVITEVTLRTYPLPHDSRTLSVQFSDAAAANRYMLAIAETTLVPTGMQLRTHKSTAIVDVQFEGLPEGIAAQIERATVLASAGTIVSVENNAWSAREEVWNGDGIVVKVRVLPSRIAEGVEIVRRADADATGVVQSLGIGMFRMRVSEVESLRAWLGKIGASAVVLRAPLEMKDRMDVFGGLPSAYPLMGRVKQQFDPKGILSRGRFLGGI